MDRNTEENINKISNILSKENSPEEIRQFVTEMLTESELETLSKRWQIMEMLSEGKTQRDIAAMLKVSLCKVTRGAHILKNKNSAIIKFINRR